MLAAAALLSACSAETERTPDQGAQKAQEAGRDYGQAIVEMVGSKASVAEMEDLCGQGAREEAAKEGKGKDTDVALEDAGVDLDAFIDGCREAVSEK